MSETQLDLSQLALDRPSQQNSTTDSRKANRKWMTRYVVPGGVLSGFVVLMLAAAGQSLLPKTSVEVVPVIVKQATVQQAGTQLFQAAGWIEPRPTVTNVPALAPGVVEEYVLTSRGWEFQAKLSLADSKKLMAPANLRASAENEAYRLLVSK